MDEIKESKVKQLLIALATAIAIFVIAIVLPKFIISGGVYRIMTTQALELGLSLLAIMTLGRGRFADYGFCLPKAGSLSISKLSQWLLPVLIALTIGALATMAVLFTGGAGNPIMKQLTFPQIILFVLILSSTIEEIFTRGFFQGHLSSLSSISIKLIFFRVDLPTLISALFFGCMHLSLLMSGADLQTIIVILIFTFSLGLLAAHIRARTGSLLPAIGLHMLGNIGGIVGGIIFNVIHFISTGKMLGS
jgi:membrane protease YdiL (CAAX protease family)